MTPLQAAEALEWLDDPAAQVLVAHARAATPGPDRGRERRSLVLADREAELLELKGPCSDPECRLHYAHRGPCDIVGAGQ